MKRISRYCEDNCHIRQKIRIGSRLSHMCVPSHRLGALGLVSDLDEETRFAAEKDRRIHDRISVRRVPREPPLVASSYAARRSPSLTAAKIVDWTMLLLPLPLSGAIVLLPLSGYHLAALLRPTSSRPSIAHRPPSSTIPRHRFKNRLRLFVDPHRSNAMTQPHMSRSTFSTFPAPFSNLFSMSAEHKANLCTTNLPQVPAALSAFFSPRSPFYASTDSIWPVNFNALVIVGSVGCIIDRSRMATKRKEVDFLNTPEPCPNFFKMGLENKVAIFTNNCRRSIGDVLVGHLRRRIDHGNRPHGEEFGVVSVQCEMIRYRIVTKNRASPPGVIKAYVMVPAHSLGSNDPVGVHRRSTAMDPAPELMSLLETPNPFPNYFMMDDEHKAQLFKSNLPQAPLLPRSSLPARSIARSISRRSINHSNRKWQRRTRSPYSWRKNVSAANDRKPLPSKFGKSHYVEVKQMAKKALVAYSIGPSRKTNRL